MSCASLWLAIDLKCKIDPKSSINHQNDINELIYVKGDQANFFFFRILTFLNVALRCFIFPKIPSFSHLTLAIHYHKHRTLEFRFPTFSNGILNHIWWKYFSQKKKKFALSPFIVKLCVHFRVCVSVCPKF